MPRNSRIVALLVALVVLGVLGGIAFWHASDDPETQATGGPVTVGKADPDNPLGDASAALPPGEDGSGAGSPPPTAGLPPTARTNDAESVATTNENRKTGRPPYSSSNPPSIEHIQDLPLGEPRSAAPPAYESSLPDDDWRRLDSSPPRDYRLRTSELFKDRVGDSKRQIRGRVFEVVGSERIPLSGVLVYNRLWNRTFTDDSGRFEMKADWRQPLEEGKRRGETYRIDLRAYSHGYIDLRGKGTYTNLDEGEHGFDLYLVRRDSHRVRICFDNPQVAGGPVTIVLARNDYSATSPVLVYDWDERSFIVARADPREEIWFSVPRRFHEELGESVFVLKSVSARNVLADNDSLHPVSTSKSETVYRVRLVFEEAFTLAGTVKDMRDGKPLPYARIYGPGETEFTVADKDGRFELIASREPKGPDGEPIPPELRYLHIAHEGHAPLRVLMLESTLSGTSTGGVSPIGGRLENAWDFSLRPLVKAVIETAALPEAYQSGAGIGLPEEFTETARFYIGSSWEVGPEGTCDVSFFPWGLEEVVAHPATLQPGLPPLRVRVPAHCWQGDGRYHLALEP